MLFFAFGAIIGAPLSGQVMEMFGPAAFFGYIGVVHLAFLLFTFWRMTRRATIARALRPRYVALLRTSPVFAKLASRDNGRSSPRKS